ncbi:hypothetical protein Q1695_014960 [Nippostrongylus brasiliensis]|nr:hypothetical protein Q1695_014960 [Nippostrongylus brasiliensis]
MAAAEQIEYREQGWAQDKENPFSTLILTVENNDEERNSHESAGLFQLFASNSTADAISESSERKDCEDQELVHCIMHTTDEIYKSTIEYEIPSKITEENSQIRQAFDVGTATRKNFERTTERKVCYDLQGKCSITFAQQI